MGPGAGPTKTMLDGACSQPAWLRGWERAHHLAAELGWSEEGHRASAGVAVTQAQAGAVRGPSRLPAPLPAASLQLSPDSCPSLGLSLGLGLGRISEQVCEEGHAETFSFISEKFPRLSL